MGLNCYAVNTHPYELVLESPLKKSWIRLWNTTLNHDDAFIAAFYVPLVPQWKAKSQLDLREVEEDLNLSVKYSVAVICIALNYWVKCKRKMVIRGIKLTGKQPATIEIPHWVHSVITSLHHHYTGCPRSRAPYNNFFCVFQIKLDMGEKLTIQERLKLVFMFGKNGATYCSGGQLLGHPV